jgi:aryl-alcohol dehydrogenase-like predicted oxidoreductase
VDHLRQVAESKGATVAQVAIAWVLSRGVHVAPLVGARRRERLSEALGAMKLTLTGDDLRQIDRAVPLNAAAGDRYAAAQMSTLDSEAD